MVVKNPGVNEVTAGARWRYTVSDLPRLEQPNCQGDQGEDHESQDERILHRAKSFTASFSRVMSPVVM